MKIVAILLGSLLLAPACVAAPKTAKTARVTTTLKWPKVKQETSYFTAETAAVQYLLRRQGFYKGKPDGIYGPQTIARVKAFQRAKGLRADGVVGPQTWPKLVATVKRGSKGDAVRALQTYLRDLQGEGGAWFPDMNTDGVFGSETENGVRAYQENYNLYNAPSRVVVDGIVGPQTWCALVGGEVVKR